MTFNKIRYSLFIGIGIASGLAAIYLFFSYAHIPVNPDAGYYISISEEVLNGANPVVDVKNMYTPGIYYAYALWIKLFGSGYATIVLLVYIVNTLNALLLYLILSEFIQQNILKIMICLSYYYSIFLLEGTSVELEPFQIFFILSAYILYLKKMPNILKYALVGLCLGCSFMFKQYSILVIFGFLIISWLDVGQEEKETARMKRISVIAVSAIIPFFAFVLFTKASLVHSLYTFGILGNVGISYITAEGQGFIEWGDRIMKSIIVRNWVFFPLIIYLFIILFRRDYLHYRKDFFLLFVFSCFPLAIRQYGHYFQLIAPWSYLILGILLKRPVDEFRKDCRNDLFFIVSIFVCFFIILPVFLYFAPTVFYPASPSIRRGTLLLSITTFSVIAWGIYHSKYKFNLDILLIILSTTIFLVTLFLSLKIPFSEMRDEKYVQLKEAEEINKIFPKGSLVYVIDYPQLYLTCRFKNPLHDYNFPLGNKAHNLSWEAIDNVIVKKDNSFISSERLAGLGYSEIKIKSTMDIKFFKKTY